MGEQATTANPVAWAVTIAGRMQRDGFYLNRTAAEIAARGVGWKLVPLYAAPPSGLDWVPVTPDGPRPAGYALWVVPVKTSYPDCPSATEVIYAKADDTGQFNGELLDVWNDDVGWKVADATHYADPGPLPGGNETHERMKDA